MRSFLYRQRAFLVPFLVLWVAVGYVQLFYSQNYIIIELNRLWSPLGDLFFSAGTYLGDGIFIVLVGLIALYFSYQKGILIFVGYAFSGLLVQLSKHYLFADSYRPAKALANVLPWLHTVEGITIYHNSSFPSGHTTSAFALFATLAFFSHSSFVRILCLLPALVVAYSRMYLLQHYLIDVHTGALLGTLSAIVTYYYVSRWWESHPVKWSNLGLKDGFNRKP